VNTPAENLDMSHPPAGRGIRSVVPSLLSLALMLVGAQAAAQQSSGFGDGSAPVHPAQFETASSGRPGLPPPPPGPYSPILDPGVSANAAPELTSERMPPSGASISAQTGYGSHAGRSAAAGTVRGAMGGAYWASPGVVRGVAPPAMGPADNQPVPMYPGPPPWATGPMPWPGYGRPVWPGPPGPAPMGPAYWRPPMRPAW